MSFKVTLRPSGHEFMVDAGERLLDAALRQSCAIPYGCRNGSCGSCAARLIEGRISYPQGLPPGLTPQEAQSGRILLCQAHALSPLVLELRESRPLPPGIEIRTLPARVVGLHRLAEDVMRLYLKVPANESFQYLAGQYIDILLKDGRRRGFSIANRPGVDEFIELHVRHVPGGEFTTHVFDEMKERAILRIQGPLGTFFVREDSQRPIIMMGGGTGFAPLKAMLERLFQTSANRPVHLYWGARHRDGLYLNELVEGWVEHQPAFRYTPVLSDPTPADAWQGRRGLVHQAVAADYPDLSGFDLYMSGPPPMIQAARETFFAQGLPEEQLFFDSFDFANDKERR